ncbi:MAG: helix-turn-helix domain-containing protein [Bdellovibrionota bacterium]
MKNLNTCTTSHLLLIENLIDKAELSNKLSLSVSYINKLMKLKKIPVRKIGRCVRFKYSEVVQALERRSTA